MARTKLMKVYSDSEHTCDRCGRQHGKVYEVQTADGAIKRVGSTCCKRLFGWTPSKSEIDEANERGKAQELVDELVNNGGGTVTPLADWLAQRRIVLYAYDYATKHGIRGVFDPNGKTIEIYA